jgi:hypothetical protein
MATTFSASLRPTRTRILLIALTVVVLLGYGLFTAQQARSTTTLAKQVWGGIRADGSIAHQKHILEVLHVRPGLYLITFDRHVDNCSLQVSPRYEGDGATYVHFEIGPVPEPSPDRIALHEVNPAATASVDGDFDIFGMCPST